ncbi:winged helix DNA-binding domain-containing protein [Paenibacillus oryzisoli]|uniref:winged helix DNA-binding domain-containing protein n=1 Tax=Paenibacillus oryzisoli TaxID=1850517 RepID=UPI003D2CB33B
MTSTPIMDSRALNRALLARQMLLSRVQLPVLDAIEKLAGLQAQAPNAPYFALWSRVEDFRQEQLSELILGRKAVRMALMRATLHLASAADALALRPWLQPVMERSLNGAFGKELQGVDRSQLAASGRSLVEEKPMTLSELGEHLQQEWPAQRPDALSAAVRNLVPLVQTPPRGIWGESGQAVHTSMELWLGQAMGAEPDAKRWIRRYLAAFGPATVKDMQVWSGLSGLGKVLEQLKGELVTFQTDQGAVLFDLPDAPRPEADTPAVPRFLGEFDNILLAHADRSRILEDRYRNRVFTSNGIVRPTILIDGYVAGTWKLHRERGKTAIVAEMFEKLDPSEKDALLEEGERLLHFVGAETEASEIIIIPQ